MQQEDFYCNRNAMRLLLSHEFPSSHLIVLVFGAIKTCYLSETMFVREKF